MSGIERELMERLKAYPWTEGMEIPPPVVRELEGEFVSVVPGESIVARWPVLDRHLGPAGTLQGGIMAAMVDNTVGPLAYLTTDQLCVTVGLDLSFVRPVTRRDGHVEVRVEVLDATRRFLFLRADVRNPDGRLIASAQTELTVLEDPAFDREETGS